MKFMKSLPLILQSALVLPLVAPLVEFATSTSGHVEPREGLALGWLGSVVAGLAVVFSTADQTQANPCYGIAEGSRGTVCRTDLPCYDHDGTPIGWYRVTYYHNSATGCEWQSASCQC